MSGMKSSWRAGGICWDGNFNRFTTEGTEKVSERKAGEYDCARGPEVDNGAKDLRQRKISPVRGFRGIAEGGEAW
jgi:hypothetical protein